MYCGDETGSFIGDIGSHTARFGYGGDNAPVYVTPALVGERGEGEVRRRVVPTSCYSHRWCRNSRDANAMDTTDDSASPYEFRSPMRMVTSSSLSNGEAVPQPLTNPVSYLAQGDVIDDWDAYEHLWTNALDTLYVKDTLKHTTGRQSSGTTAASGVASATIASNSATLGDSKCIHPFLVVSPGCTHSVRGSSVVSDSSKQKQMVQLTELLMETLGATAVFVAPTPMLAAFAHGRQSCLVVDIGASGTRVTPVVDGLLLRQAQRRSGRGGDWLDNCAWQALMNNETPLVPRYQVGQKHSNVHGLFYRWAMRDLMYELRTSEHVAVPQWWYDPTVPFSYAEGEMEASPVASSALAGTNTNYELPDGTLIDMTSRVGKDLCRLPELLFGDDVPFADLQSADQMTASRSILDEHGTLSNASLPKLVHASLSAVADVDVRKDLAASIVLTGGCAVTPNLEQRLSLELPRITSAAYKPKVVASRYAVERQSAAWIGGSILTSLGSFQQLWLSKTEYEEYGATLAVQRFP